MCVDDIEKSLSCNMDKMSTGNWHVNVVKKYKKIWEKNWLGEIHLAMSVKMLMLIKINDRFDLINNFAGS